MPSDFDLFKKRHDKAMAEVKIELSHMLPTELELLAEKLNTSRHSYDDNYKFLFNKD